MELKRNYMLRVWVLDVHPFFDEQLWKTEFLNRVSEAEVLDRVYEVREWFERVMPDAKVKINVCELKPVLEWSNKAENIED